MVAFLSGGRALRSGQAQVLCLVNRQRNPWCGGGQAALNWSRCHRRLHVRTINTRLWSSYRSGPSSVSRRVLVILLQTSPHLLLIPAIGCHGTQRRNLPGILDKRLLPGGVHDAASGGKPSRNSVHLAPYSILDQRCKSGMRIGGEVDLVVYCRRTPLLVTKKVYLSDTGV